jgi:hypothetical protein
MANAPGLDKGKGIGEVLGAAEKIKQTSEKEAAAERSREAALEKKVSQVENVERAEIKQKIKEIKSTMPSTGGLMLALIIAVIYDTADIILTIFTGGTSETVEWIVDFVMQGLMYWLLKGSYSKIMWLEFVPGLDLVPLYTITVLYSWYKARKATGGYTWFLSKIGRTGGPSYLMGIIIFLIILLGGGFAVYLIFGLPIAILFAAVALAIMLFYFESTRGIAFLLIVILILGAVAYATISSFGLISGIVGTDTTLGRVLAMPGKTMANTKLFFANFISGAKKAWERQVYTATGDYYTGKVDENAEEKLGVYLENVKQADPKLYEDQPVTVYATLVAKTLDKPINITVACKSGNNSGKIYPKEIFSVDVYEEQEIDCTFEQQKLGTGSKIIEVAAMFDFKTMAYVKSYFMNQDTLRSLRRQEVDPLGQYGITDTEPTATYTNGPVMIGMSAGKPPIGVDKQEDKLVTTLGITIDNNWEGKVKEIKRLFVIVPSEFIVHDVTGLGVFKKNCKDLGESDKGCDDALYNIYQINPYAAGAKNKEFDTFKTYRILLESPASMYSRLLGGAPVSTKYFKVMVEYDYALETKMTVEIFKPQAVQGVLAPSGDVTAPNIVGAVTKSPFGTGVILIWKTDEESNDRIDYWLVTSPHDVMTYQEFGFTKDHSATINGLGTGKQYGFRIISKDKLNNEKQNPNDVFTV